jgi:hypothetical protein
MGKPSIIVAAALADPGAPIKIAGMESEVSTGEIRPITSGSAAAASSFITKGRIRARATVPPTPGMIPVMRPRKIPTRNNNK